MNPRRSMAEGCHGNAHSHLRHTGDYNYSDGSCLHRLAHMASAGGQTGSGKAALDQAWREVLDDAYDMERRHFEERKRVENYEHKRTAAAK
jgi:hypothetical protein